MSSVYLHVLVPPATVSADACCKVFGDPSGTLDLDDGDTPSGLLVWTLDEPAAREQGVVRGLFSDLPTIVPHHGDSSGRYWPRVAFTTRRSLDAAPDRLLDAKPREVVGGEAGLWLHFVDDPSRRRRHVEKTGPFSCVYADAVMRGVWGIEEGYCEGGSYPAGWWVTSSPDPGPQPAKLHSVF